MVRAEHPWPTSARQLREKNTPLVLTGSIVNMGPDFQNLPQYRGIRFIRQGYNEFRKLKAPLQCLAPGAAFNRVTVISKRKVLMGSLCRSNQGTFGIFRRQQGRRNSYEEESNDIFGEILDVRSRRILPILKWLRIDGNYVQNHVLYKWKHMCGGIPRWASR